MSVLCGIRVLEFEAIVAAPFGAIRLADQLATLACSLRFDVRRPDTRRVVRDLRRKGYLCHADARLFASATASAHPRSRSRFIDLDCALRGWGFDSEELERLQQHGLGVRAPVPGKAEPDGSLEDGPAGEGQQW